MTADGIDLLLQLCCVVGNYGKMLLFAFAVLFNIVRNDKEKTKCMCVACLH